MPLFTDALLDELGRLPGAGHSFLKQLALDEAAGGLREALDARIDAVPDEVGRRWRDLMGSLDNRRFVQGLAELRVVRHLGRTGWEVVGLEYPGPDLVLSRAGTELRLLTLAFAPQFRPGPDRAVIERLSRALDRVGSRSRIAVHVRRWLPHDFDPEPVRRAIDLWLREVDRGGWEGRYAAYEDEHVALEFALTGEQAGPEGGVVAFTLGPFYAWQTRGALEERLLRELDRTVAERRVGRPLVVACVSTEAWDLGAGHLREVLLGKPRCIEIPEDGSGRRLHYPHAYAPAVFRDPVYAGVSAVLLLEGSAHIDGARSDLPAPCRTWLAPWARRPLPPEAFAGPLLRTVEEGEGKVVLAWTDNG